MKKKIFALIFALVCLALLICSCGDDEHTHESTTQPSSITSGIPDNQNPPSPPAPQEPCDHLWSYVTVSTDTESVYYAKISGTCSICLRALSATIDTSIDNPEEWRNALSADNLKSFTVVNGVNYANYDENGCFVWRVVNDIQTEEYYVSSDTQNSAYYVNEYFLGYSLKFENFTYDREKRAFVNQINDTSYIEIMFADKKIFSISTVSTGEGHEVKSTTLYLNHNKITVSVPDYFFDRYAEMTALDVISSKNISKDYAEKIYAVLTDISFETSKYEVAYAENGALGVHFYLENQALDPIFGTYYSEVSVSFYNDTITSVTIGANTIDLSN